MIFSWQKEQWQHLWRAKLENRLAHAWVFVGISGTGKSVFADHFTRALLCQNVNSEGESCDTCHACRLMAGRVHPNILWIEPEKAVIKIDQIREVANFVNESSLQGKYRMVIMNPANAMNANAANALLKTLEEPSQDAILILISDQNGHLPPTILSRCQRLFFPRPPTPLAIEWLHRQLRHAKKNTLDPELMLNLAQGAPLSAWQFMQEETFSVRHELFQALSQMKGDPIKSAMKMQDRDLLKVLDLILSWVMDLLRLQLGGTIHHLVNKDYAHPLMELKSQRPPHFSIQFMEYLSHLRIQICTGFNLNKQLTIENMLIRWMGCDS
jgi:DNA polymerase III subunit delta'